MAAPRARLQELLREPGLAPLLPFVAAIWADGELSGEESAALRAPGWLDRQSRELLARWLDPERPPMPTELLRLRRHLREAASRLPASIELTLADLGLELGRRRQVPEVDEATLRTELGRLQGALGLSSTELAREVLATTLQTPSPTLPVAAPPAFDGEAMQALLDGPYAQRRRDVREILSRPSFRHRHEASIAARRAQVLAWLRELADEGLGELAFPGVTTDVDAGHFFAVFETLATFDVALMTKLGVQFGLFGGSIYHLGSDEQRRRWLPAVATLELPGCFAMSELGHGSNVRDLETLATYDESAGEFEIHTPSETARKEWIGNAALHGRMATVFAQLCVGDECHGVHAFLVPLRDGAGRALPGVRIEDCGPKNA